MNNLEPQSSKNNDLIRLLPFMINERNKLFSYRDCKFACEKEKENTARIVIFKELGIINTYTLEASFYGGEALGKVVYEEESSSEGSEIQEDKEADEEVEDDMEGEDEEEEDENEDQDEQDVEEEIKLEQEVREKSFEKSAKNVAENTMFDEDQKVTYNSESETKKTKPKHHLYLPSSNKVKLPSINTSVANQKLKTESPEKDMEEEKVEVKKKKVRKVIGDIHLKTKHLRVIGQDFCKTLYLFFNESIQMRRLHNLRRHHRPKITVKKKTDK